MRAAPPGRWWRPHPPAPFGTQDAAELAGLLAALSRAGLPPSRTWQILAGQPSGLAAPARVVSGMLTVGGSLADGLLAAERETRGDGVPVLAWLRVTAAVAQRTGAGPARVYDELVHGIHEELEQAQERAVALAGPRATALVLALLPLAGFVLALLMGVNTLAVLTGSGPGRICLFAGAGLWFAGRQWIRRLMAAAQPEPG